MPKFDDVREVEQLCFQMRQSDYPRGQNRALIDELFNGVPPYTPQEVEQNRINVNVNDLSSTRLGHEARSQLYSNFLKPGLYFRCSTDRGPAHKRSMYSSIVTRNVNRIMKRSLDYYECFRSKFALDVLHGISPSVWEDPDCWCPNAMGIEDVLIPANTLLTMRNLPFFAIYRSWTAPELMKLTRAPKLDPGWNMTMVNKCIEYIDSETMALMGTNWPEVWAPEKAQERVKGDGGFYVGDQVPTIDCWDFYFYSEDGDDSGWRRRIILDAWSEPQASGGAWSRNSKLGFAKDQFLYTSRKRKFADKREQIVAFQFADLSAVAPFRYHSVRSLGFLLYSVCHLQNRLRCKFNESVFEALMNYFKVKSQDDFQRALKVEMVNKGFIDDSIQFVPAQDRWQVNAALVELGLAENTNLINKNASSYTTTQNQQQDKRDKTRFEVMAEVNSATQLVSAALIQTYTYQKFEYMETFRRFCKKRSRDPEVLEFRAMCLRDGVPPNLLVPDAWDIEPDRVLGAGNKTMEMTIAQQLLEMRNLFDPEPQRKILRDVTLAITDDPARAEDLVPDKVAQVTDSVHDAQLAAGSLLAGLPVAVKTGINHIEYVETLLADMAILVGRIQKSGGMTTPDKLMGLQNLAVHIEQHIGIIAQDEEEKQRVKKYGDQLGKLMNLVKAFAQRLQQQMQQQNGQQQMDPKDVAKLKSQEASAKIKQQNTRESHAQRTVQRQIQFEQDMQQRKQEHEIDMLKEVQQLKLQEHKMRSTESD